MSVSHSSATQAGMERLRYELFLRVTHMACNDVPMFNDLRFKNTRQH